jgi:hypothetical protein
MVQVIGQALEHDPHRRWRSTSDITRALTSALGPQYGARPGGGAPGLGPAYPTQPHTAQKSKRPTTRLLLTVARWSNAQIAVVLSVALVLIAVGFWFGMPVVARWVFIWNNVSSFAIIAPLVYAALRKYWLPSITHVLLVMVSVIISSIQMLPGGWTTWRLEWALLSALVSGLVIEGFIRLVERIQGRNRSEAWQRELAWLCLMSVVATVLRVAIFWGLRWLASPVRWISAAVLGAVGWFVGDLVQQFMYLKQTGMKRGRGGS